MVAWNVGLHPKVFFIQGLVGVGATKQTMPTKTRMNATILRISFFMLPIIPESVLLAIYNFFIPSM
jgi:hypothetical protein